MARSANVASKAERVAINDAFWGALEPELSKPLGTQLNWYNATRDDKEAIQYLVQYLDLNGREADIEKVERLHPDWIPRTAAWLCRLSARGYPLTPHNYASIEEGLRRAFNHVQEAPIDAEEKVVPDIQARVREKVSEFNGEVEGLIDDYLETSEDWSLYDYLRSQEATTPVARDLVNRLAPRLAELKEVIAGTNPDLSEGYRHYNRKQIGAMATKFEQMLDDAQRYSDNLKKSRAPRKKKKQSAEKLLKSFKYAKTFEEFKLASIDPRKIIGANELWTFHTKYNLLSVYRGQLSVKGTTIIGYDERNSFQTKIGRKTQEALDTILTGGKVALRKFAMKHPVKTGRTSSDTILLRVS